MDERVFDAMLKNALEEALLEDLSELKKAPPVRPSLRFRRQMARLLHGRIKREEDMEMREIKQERPFRKQRLRPWIAAAVITALLAGTAAAHSLRGGEFFRWMMESSPWADQYGKAADTERLLEMGGGNVGAVVEDEHFRFELIDAVSEGENAMAAVKITVLDMAPLERAFGKRSCAPGLFLSQDGTFLETGSYSVEYLYADWDAWLEENQFCLIFQTNQNRAAEDQRYTLTFHDFGYYQYEGDAAASREKRVLIPGSWTLEIQLGFDGGTTLALGETIQGEGYAFTVDSVTISSMSVRLRLHYPWADEKAVREALRGAELLLKDGTALPATGFRLAGRGEDEAGFAADMTLKFPMPLDQAEFAGLAFGEQILYFSGNSRGDS